jgi:hypothetical protein
MTHTPNRQMAANDRVQTQAVIAAQEAVIAWTPGWYFKATGVQKRTQTLVEVRPYGRGGHSWTKAYACSGGAAHPSWRKASHLLRSLWLSNLLIELVFVDEVDAATAFKTFQQITEFKAWLPTGLACPPVTPERSPSSRRVWQ